MLLSLLTKEKLEQTNFHLALPKAFTPLTIKFSNSLTWDLPTDKNVRHLSFWYESVWKYLGSTYAYKRKAKQWNYMCYVYIGSPIMRQTTLTALLSKLSPQTVPQVPLCITSTVPDIKSPPTRRISKTMVWKNIITTC